MGTVRTNWETDDARTVGFRSNLIGPTAAGSAVKGSPRRGPAHHRTDTECGVTGFALTQGVALHVLFVCTGNICRSPTAERLAFAYGARFQVRDFSASSAGTRAVIGHPIHRDAALVIEKLGGEVSNFAARQLTSRIASDADLVLTMTKAHRDTLLELAPRQLRKTFTLSEAARLVSQCKAESFTDLAALRPQLAAHESSDIPDPIGRGAEVFAMVGSQIADLLPPILELCRRSSASSSP